MEWLRFSGNSIPFLTHFILSLVITLTFLRVKNKSMPTRLLAGSFAWMTCGLLFAFLKDSVYAPWRAYLSYPIMQFFLLGNIAELQFIYRFPKLYRPREARVVLVISILIALVGFGFTIKQVADGARVLTNNETEDQIKAVLFLIEAFWMVIVLLRQISPVLNGEGSPWPQQFKPDWYRSLINTFKAIIKPPEKQVRAIRSVIFANLILAEIFLIYALRNTLPFTEEIFSIIMHVSLLTYLFVFVITYFNNSPDQTPIRAKLMLSSLVTSLAVLAVASIIVLPSYARNYDALRLAQIQQVQKLLINHQLLNDEASLISSESNGKLPVDELPDDLQMIIARPLNPGSSPTPYRTIFSRNGNNTDALNNYIVTENKAIIDAQLADRLKTDASLDIERERQRLIDDFNRINWQVSPADMLKRMLRPFGKGFYDRTASYWLVMGDEKYEFWFDINDYFYYIHRGAKPLAILIVSTTLLIICVFPLFFTSLVRPLDSLLIGVKQINDGDLDITVPIEYPDEIGYLTESFNTMAGRLRKLVNGLQQQVAERTAQLQANVVELGHARDQALDANRAKSLFLSNMSHELRTPLNAVIGFAQLMNHAKDRSSEDREHLEIILQSGEHLLGLINDVLSLAKIEAGKLTLNQQSFNLSRMLSGVTEMIKVRASAKDLQLNCELADNLPINVIGDEGKLRQVLINLLGNAVKFTNLGSVTLRVAWQADRAHFEVIDTGPGIAEAELSKLFEAFSQTQTGQNAKEGTGLGLSISRNIVKLMDGDIYVTSKVGEGTRFRFDISLPRADQAIEAFEPGKIIGLADTKTEFRILVVDDKRENRLLLMRLLSQIGFQVREAVNGAEAVKCWSEWQPQLIWMDIHMPVMDGYNATKNIRAAEKDLSTRTTIIALTATVFEQERAAALTAGFDDFVVKPFHESVIFDRLANYLGVKYCYEAARETPSSESGQIDDNHGSNSSNDAEPILSARRLAALPGDWLNSLDEALTVGNKRAALKIVEQIGERDSLLADELKKMVKQFQIDELRELIRSVPA